MKIEVSLGGQRIKEYDLDGEVTGDSQSELILWIGRLESCFIVLEKSQVSREHAKLRYTGGRWEIEVLDSCRPIQVNGKTVETSPLRPNDIIHLSPYMLKVLGEPSIGDQDEGKEEGGLDEEAEDVQEEYSLEDSGEGQESADEYPELEPELKEEAQEQEQEQEQEDYGQEAFEQEHAMEVVDGAGEKTEVVSSFSTFILDIFGEHVPYDTFIIEKDETFIGRDPEKCQIVLPDSEVSSVHAVIKKTKVQITLEDLKSGNGTILNGERINKKELSNGDEFVIGSATFSVRMESDFIKQEHQSLMPVEENQVVEVEEIVEVDEDFADNDASNGGQESKDRSLIGQLRGLLTKEALQDPAKRKKLIYLVAGVLLLLIFLEVPEEDVAPKKKNVKAQEKPLKKKTSLDPKVLEFVDSTYQLALELFERAKYQECIHQLDALFQKTPTYKQAKSLYQAAKDALKELEIIEEKNRKLKAMIERKKKIQKLLDKANQAVTSRRVELAEQIFLQIVQLDPENLDVVQLRLELDHYKKKKEKEEIEKAAKKSERKRQEKALLPGKLLYSKKKWYSAVIELEKLINKEKNLDKDLFDEADKMLVESQNNLDGLVSPLLAKARSLKEGKDLKGAYEQYLEILSHDPEHFEAFKQMREIRQQLETRSKTIYREGIISESLSLFHQAKEKFQEVQQVSPIDSKYYKKATQKLKDYGE